MSGGLDSAGLVGIDMGGMGGDDRLVRMQQGFHNDEIGLGTAYQEVNIGVRSTADAADSFPGGCTAGIQTVAHSLFQIGVHQGLENFWVGALAVISTQNSTVNSLAVICQGMAKMNMLPKVFAKTNKHKVPWFGQVFVSVSIFIFAYVSDSSADMISFLILAGSVFWMVSYILAHVDVIVFRKRLPRAPRNFKVPCGLLFPIIGIVGTIYMILNISTDPQERLMLWLLTGCSFLILGIYSAIWIKVKMKMKVFKSVPLENVMAMENDLYYEIRRKSGLWK